MVRSHVHQVGTYCAFEQVSFENTSIINQIPPKKAGQLWWVNLCGLIRPHPPFCTKKSLTCVQVQDFYSDSPLGALVPLKMWFSILMPLNTSRLSSEPKTGSEHAVASRWPSFSLVLLYSSCKEQQAVVCRLTQVSTFSKPMLILCRVDISMMGLTLCFYSTTVLFWVMASQLASFLHFSFMISTSFVKYHFKQALL